MCGFDRGRECEIGYCESERESLGRRGRRVATWQAESGGKVLGNPKRDSDRVKVQGTNL